MTTTAWDKALGNSRRTTGIGSLPHHNADAALEFSFRMGVPFLPQIPIRNPWEYMIAQALEGLPGFQAERDGSCTMNSELWDARAGEFGRKLTNAFARSEKAPDAFEPFEPSSATASCWQPYLWELEERGRTLAKVQIAGPLTSQWALRERGDPLREELTTQIFQLVTARALAMCRRLQSAGIQPLLYLDEPGLYALNPAEVRHQLALRELSLVVQALRKENVLVGVHCCSNTHWPAVLGLGLDFISIDTELSLASLLQGSAQESHPLRTFLRGGGRLSLGVIPTGRGPLLHSIQVKEIFAKLMETFAAEWGQEPELARKVMNEALFTPACGLALHTVADAEHALEALTEFHDLCAVSVRGH